MSGSRNIHTHPKEGVIENTEGEGLSKPSVAGISMDIFYILDQDNPNVWMNFAKMKKGYSATCNLMICVRAVTLFKVVY